MTAMLSDLFDRGLIGGGVRVPGGLIEIDPREIPGLFHRNLIAGENFNGCRHAMLLKNATLLAQMISGRRRARSRCDQGGVSVMLTITRTTSIIGARRERPVRMDRDHDRSWHWLTGNREAGSSGECLQ